MPKNIFKIFSISYPILVFLLAFFIRIYNIELLPINHDEAHWVRVMLGNPHIIKEIMGIPRISLPCPFNYYQNFLVPYLSSFEPISLNEFIFYMRFEPVTIGAATVLLLYLLARRMYGQRTAVLSSFLLCFLPWHIIYSRILCGVIWIPFYGCLIFLSLFNAVQIKRKLWTGIWFLLACLFLRESIGGYKSAILFIPIFFVSLLCLSKEFNFPRKIIIIAVVLLLAVVSIWPFIYNIAVMGDEYWKFFFRDGQKNIFEGSVACNLLENFKNNAWFALNQLFFTPRASFIYGEAFSAPLLIHPVTFILLVVSLRFAFWKRKTADKILLIWLILGFLGIVTGASIFQARFALIILPPALILIGRAIAEIFNKRSLSRKIINKYILLIVGVTILGGIITAENIQWAHFYYKAPFDFEQCRTNSYGGEQAGKYLSQLPNIKNYYVIYDVRMTADVYLYYYLWESGKINKFEAIQGVLEPKSKAMSKGVIYVLWSLESHPKEVCEIWYRGTYENNIDVFAEVCSYATLIKTIYYPNGLPAINIYMIEEKTYI